MQRDSVDRVVLGALLLISVFLNVLQARHIREISDNISAANPQILQVGSSLGALEVKGLSGREVKVDYGGLPPANRSLRIFPFRRMV